MSISQELQKHLTKFVQAFHEHKASLATLNHLSPRHISSNAFFAGEHLNAIVKSSVATHCKQYEGNNGGTRANIDKELGLTALLGQNASLFDAYDREIDNCENPAQEHLELIEMFILNLDTERFHGYLLEAQSQLTFKGTQMAADNIAETFEFEGSSYTGKAISIRGNKVTLYSSNPARWEFGEVYWENRALASKASALVPDLRFIAEQTGMTDLSSLFIKLAQDANELGWAQKLDSRYSQTAGGATQLKVFKKHLALTISRDDFDALMSFIVANSTKEIKVNTQSLAA